MLGYYKQDGADGRRRFATAGCTRATWAICPAASCSSAAGRRTSSSSTAGSTIRRISSGPWTSLPACGAGGWWRSARPSAGSADRVVIVVEPSGTVRADALTDTIRRRIGDLFGLYVGRRGARAERHGGRARRAAKCSARRPRRATSAAIARAGLQTRRGRRKRGGVTGDRRAQMGSRHGGKDSMDRRQAAGVEQRCATFADAPTPGHDGDRSRARPVRGRRSAAGRR